MEAKNQWLMALMEAGIDDWSMVEGGLAELRQTPGQFLPSTGDFIQLCWTRKFKQMKIPTESEAYTQLQNFMAPRDHDRDFSQLNPAVYAAYTRLDWSLMTTESDTKQRKLFSDAWRQVLNSIKAGHKLPTFLSPKKRLQEKKYITQSERSKKIGTETLENLKNLL